MAITPFVLNRRGESEERGGREKGGEKKRKGKGTHTPPDRLFPFKSPEGKGGGGGGKKEAQFCSSIIPSCVTWGGGKEGGGGRKEGLQDAFLI